MKIFKYIFIVLGITLFSVNVQAQGEEKALLEILDGMSDAEKLKILEYAKAQKKNIEAQILAVMDELPRSSKANVVEYAMTLKDANVAASNGSDVSKKHNHNHPHEGEEKVKPNMKLTSMKFEKSTIQFGRVKEGKTVERRFKFQNTGSHPLEIISAKGSCGCTVPQVPQKPIPPGGFGTIVVKFNTTKKVGKRSQSVTIIANTNPKVTQVYLQGEVFK